MKIFKVTESEMFEGDEKILYELCAKILSSKIIDIGSFLKNQTLVSKIIAKKVGIPEDLADVNFYMEQLANVYVSVMYYIASEDFVSIFKNPSNMITMVLDRFFTMHNILSKNSDDRAESGRILNEIEKDFPDIITYIKEKFC